MTKHQSQCVFLIDIKHNIYIYIHILLNLVIYMYIYHISYIIFIHLKSLHMSFNGSLFFLSYAYLKAKMLASSAP